MDLADYNNDEQKDLAEIRKLTIIEGRSILRNGLARVLTDDLSYNFAIESWESPGSFLEKKHNDPSGIILLSGDQLKIEEISHFSKEIRKKNPNSKIVVYNSMTPLDASSVLPFIGNVDGYLSDILDTTNLNNCILILLSGKKFISEDLIWQLLSLKQTEPTVHFKLSKREKTVANYLINGTRVKEIADLIGLKVSTVSTMKAHIYQKANVNNIIALSKALDKNSI